MTEEVKTTRPAKLRGGSWEVWQVDRHVINKWGALAKKADGGNVVVPLYQVKAWLSRRRPEAVEPVVSPVEVTLGRWLALARHEKKGGRLRRALIVPDLHFGFRKNVRTGALTPFHDRRALDVLLQAAALGEWDDVVLLGDVMDFAELSDKFLRSPEFYWTVQPAVIEAAWWLGKLAQAGRGARMRMIQGNHELRAETAIVTHLIAAYDLRPADEMALPPALSAPRLLGLEKLGIEWVGGYPDAAVWLTDDLRCVHGDVARANPGDTAKAVVQKSPVSVVMGHIHRIEMATRSEYRRGGKMGTITTMCPGCLCRVDGEVPGHQRGQHWQQGFGTVVYEETGDLMTMYATPLRDGRAVWEGQVLEGRDQINALRRDTGWKF
jgi:hypothetical protein